MSIDLDWLKLDASLANHLVDILNRQLENSERPSFIGPVHVVSLDFGSNAPDVELVDLRDIYRDFLEDDEDEDHGPVKVTEGGMVGTGLEDEEGFEWVSRRVGVRRDLGGGGNGNQQYLPPHVRQYGYSGPGDYFTAPSIPNAMDPWSSGLSRPPCFSDYATQPLPYAIPVDAPYRSPSPATPFVTSPHPLRSQQQRERDSGEHPESPSTNSPPSATAQPSHIPPQLQEPPSNPHPNLQLHLHINWHSNLRISLQTSLLINYPSPMFMSLPIRLSVTGLVFNGELAVAYEGERKRVHLCILDDLDPYGPAGTRGRPNELNMSTGSNSSLNSPVTGVSAGGRPMTDESNTSTPPELEDSIIMGAPGLSSSSDFKPSPTAPINANSGTSSKHPLGYHPTTQQGRQKKSVLPVGQRLLPSIYIESEIGQTDKHVLKNVTRVERFIQDVIRKTVEDELVFPNFHTLVMGEEG